MSNNNIEITLPDGSVRPYPSGVTGMQIALDISEGLARNVLAAKVNDEVWDAGRPIISDSKVALLTWKDQEGKATFWHSSAHLLAEALESLYPGIQLGIGPSIDAGFYYDVDFGDLELSADELPKIEARMVELAREKNTYQRSDVSKQDAIAYFKKKKDKYGGLGG